MSLTVSYLQLKKYVTAGHRMSITFQPPFMLLPSTYLTLRVLKADKYVGAEYFEFWYYGFENSGPDCQRC